MKSRSTTRLIVRLFGLTGRRSSKCGLTGAFVKPSPQGHHSRCAKPAEKEACEPPNARRLLDGLLRLPTAVLRCLECAQIPHPERFGAGRSHESARANANSSKGVRTWLYTRTVAGSLERFCLSKYFQHIMTAIWARGFQVDSMASQGRLSARARLLPRMAPATTTPGYRHQVVLFSQAGVLSGLKRID